MSAKASTANSWLAMPNIGQIVLIEPAQISAPQLAVTANVVNASRTEPPDTIINRVEAITGGKPFSRIEDVIDPAELRAIAERYARTAGYDVQTANRS